MFRQVFVPEVYLGGVMADLVVQQRIQRRNDVRRGYHDGELRSVPQETRWETTLNISQMHPKEAQQNWSIYPSIPNSHQLRPTPRDIESLKRLAASIARECSGMEGYRKSLALNRTICKYLWGLTKGQGWSSNNVYCICEAYHQWRKISLSHFAFLALWVLHNGWPCASWLADRLKVLGIIPGMPTRSFLRIWTTWRRGTRNDSKKASN